METIKKHGTMIKIDKRYTIKFSYGGVAQYADFSEVKGKLINPYLSVSWARNDLKKPDISKFTKIEDVLEAIKSFAYGKQAEIYLIDGVPVFYYKKVKTRKYVKEIALATQTFIESQIKLFFDTELKPLLIKNKWSIGSSHVGYLVLIEKNKNGEWANISNSNKQFEFEFLCAKCLLALNIGKSIELKREQTIYISESHNLFNYISEHIIKSEFYLDL